MKNDPACICEATPLAVAEKLCGMAADLRGDVDRLTAGWPVAAAWSDRAVAVYRELLALAEELDAR